MCGKACRSARRENRKGSSPCWFRRRGSGEWVPQDGHKPTLRLCYIFLFPFSVLSFFFFKPITLETSMKIPHIPTANKMISLIQITEVWMASSPLPGCLPEIACDRTIISAKFQTLTSSVRRTASFHHDHEVYQCRVTVLYMILFTFGCTGSAFIAGRAFL